MVSGVVSFLREKYSYILGFAIIEAGIYYFNGPTGNFHHRFSWSLRHLDLLWLDKQELAGPHAEIRQLRGILSLLSRRACHRTTRRLHFVGSSLALFCLLELFFHGRSLVARRGGLLGLWLCLVFSFGVREKSAGHLPVIPSTASWAIG